MSCAQTVRLCLSSWITHLLTAVPLRACATFVELPCGCLISPEGWVIRAISAITRGRHWTIYYKLLERGRVRTLRLARALFEVINDALSMETLNLVIDDTLIPRQSEKASSSIHSARPCQEAQPAAVSAGAMLGHVGCQRAGQCG
jgi:hypothetical protein